MNKLKQRWGITSNYQFVIIFIVFTITGSTAVYIVKPIFNAIGFYREIFDEGWHWSVLYRVIRIIAILPVYQVLLVCYGWLFGQFKFFWNFEKKMLRGMGLGFLFKDK
ncbi:DUF6787 family protein [Zhouia sp. PK063]|uniref:DUF6787 family protein n=1 Tax=Zhouia sp. PK063 TaxID=3373602 RepID=UPI0037B9A929